MAENTPTLAKALAEFAERKRVKTDNFRAGADGEQIQMANTALPYPIPIAWQEVLKISNGFLLANIQWPDAAQISPPDTGQMKHIQETAPIGSLIVAWDFSGDVFCLDVANQTASGDCPTLWTNHEGEPEMWPSIPAMLLYMIAQDKLDDGVI